WAKRSRRCRSDGEPRREEVLALEAPGQGLQRGRLDRPRAGDPGDAGRGSPVPPAAEQGGSRLLAELRGFRASDLHQPDLGGPVDPGHLGDRGEHPACDVRAREAYDPGAADPGPVAGWRGGLGYRIRCRGRRIGWARSAVRRPRAYQGLSDKNYYVNFTTGVEIDSTGG